MTTRTPHVEYRLLQLVVSHLGGDRLTVGLLHWDGHELRVASSRAPFAMLPQAHRSAVRETAAEFIRSARRLERAVKKNPPLDIGLKELFPVREGLGASLHWTPVASLEARDAASHFSELRRSLRLDEQKSGAEGRVTRAGLRARMIALGQELHPLAPSRVLVEHSVQNKQIFVTPISWKNGEWHDALPVSFDAGPERFDGLAQRFVGLVEMAIPGDHVPVMVAAFPRDLSSRARAEAEAAAVKECLARRRLEVFDAGAGAPGIDLAGLAARIRGDLQGHRES
jgi:hypothetical protein